MVHTSPASISLAICRWCDICTFNVRNKDVVVVVVDAKQYHLASFSTRNSTLNTSLRKPIRMQDFVQLCDSNTSGPGCLKPD